MITTRTFSSGADAMQYSALKQISKTNVGRLQLVPGSVSLASNGLPAIGGCCEKPADDDISWKGADPGSQGYYMFALPD